LVRKFLKEKHNQRRN